MMKNFSSAARRLAGAAVGLVLATGAAQAATVTFSTQANPIGPAPSITTGLDTVVFNLPNNAQTYWTIVFDAATPFDLILTNYNNAGQSGLTLDGTGGRLTTDAPDACNAAGACDLINNTLVGTSVLQFGAGTYTLGVYEFSQASTNVGFRFEDASPVPVPAAGALLISALAVGGLVSRRRSKS